MKSLVLFFLAFAFSLNIFADTISDKEKNALIKLYHATNGGQWKTKWDLSLSAATWNGVETDNGKVVGLNLANNNLQGKLPVELLDLVNLVQVDLHKNRLQGELPLEIGRLSKLEVLSLFDNQIQGDLPGSIYKLINLKVLLLNNNKFSGSLSKEIINYGALQNLSLFDNNFEGEFRLKLKSCII
ncbi:Two component regulator three Y domain protein [Flavobacterium sp.]|uniref:Two component regulator three Y domain protein n=1 Tax=Flavobacterium sp. TaxID=239 RepID=UPI003D1504A8